MQSAVLPAIKEFIDFQRRHATICIHFNFKTKPSTLRQTNQKKSWQKKKYIENMVRYIKKRIHVHMELLTDTKKGHP